MKKICLLFIAAAFIQGCSTTPATRLPESSIKGSIIPPYPENTELYQSACIGENTAADEKDEKLCNFSIKVFKSKSTDNFILAATVATGNKSNGHPEWKVKDALTLAETKGNSFIEVFTCRYKGVADDTIVALIPEHTGNTAKYIPAIEWAYKISLPEAQFEALQPDLVDCENTALGVE